MHSKLHRLLASTSKNCKGVRRRLEEYFLELEHRLRKKYYGWEGAKQFEGTGDRLTRAFEEMYWDNAHIEEEVNKHFRAAFVDSFDEMLVIGPMSVWTLCPHHLLPCSFQVYVGYIPESIVLGLSKFSRIASTLGKRPVMQEMYTRELADLIQDRLKPQGVGVFVAGEHGCMRCRGVQQQAKAYTAALRGVMLHKSEARAEFYSIIKQGGN